MMKLRRILTTAACVVVTVLLVVASAGCSKGDTKSFTQEEFQLRSKVSEAAEKLFPSQGVSAEILKSAADPSELIVSIVLDHSSASKRKAQDQQFVSLFRELKAIDGIEPVGQLHLNLHNDGELKVIYDVEDFAGATEENLDDYVIIVDLNE